MSIQTNMKTYTYTTLGGRNEYGELTEVEATIIPTPITPPFGPIHSFSTGGNELVREIKMAIYLSNQATNQNINYVEADYIGLTKEPIETNALIQYENKKLKVKYINPQGRYYVVALVKV